MLYIVEDDIVRIGREMLPVESNTVQTKHNKQIKEMRYAHSLLKALCVSTLQNMRRLKLESIYQENPLWKIC